MRNVVKRSDLVEQFERIVQQEIKNFHETARSFSNSIMALREDVINIKKNINTFIPNHEYRHQELLNEFNERDKHIEHVCECNRLLIETLSFRIDRFNDLISAVDEKHKELFLEREVFNNEISHFDKTCSGLHSEIEVCENFSKRLVSELRGELAVEIQKIRDEIKNVPDKIPELKNNLDKRIDACNFDKDGVLKELRVYKKNMFIIEKKIENIYTLIERLKKKVAN